MKGLLSGLVVGCLLACLSLTGDAAAESGESTQYNEANETLFLDTKHWELFKQFLAPLKAGHSIPTQDWNKFAETLDSVNLVAKSVKASYELAFNPNLAEERKALTGFKKVMVSHLVSTAENIDATDQFIAAIDFQKLSQEAMTLAAAWLPEHLKAHLQPKTIRFIPFGPDGYADNGAIIVDPYLALLLGKEAFTKLIAHELHHVYTLEHFPRPEIPTDSPLYAVFSALNQLQIEGIADMIDKGPVPIKPSIPAMTPISQRFNTAFVNAPKTLKAFDNLLISWPVADEEQHEHGSKIRQLFVLGGHPDGYYMANIIKDTLGTQALIQTVKNPFEFIRAYQTAAKRGSNGPTLSMEAMAMQTLFESTIYNVEKLP